MKRRVLVSSREAVVGKVQHKAPCTDCPMARRALPGWLGGATPEEYARLAHSDHVVNCHMIKRTQCAGMAIYRANVFKRTLPLNIQLPKDHEAVFSNPMEFLAHHSRNPADTK